MGGGGNGNRGTGMGRNSPDLEAIDGLAKTADLVDPDSRPEFELATAAASFREMVSDMFRESAAITASASMGLFCCWKGLFSSSNLFIITSATQGLGKCSSIGKLHMNLEWTSEPCVIG